MANDGFAAKLLRWYDRHGRHDLPWQQQRSLYRVWLSEIMLQQTQVTTVIPYFERFIERCPDTASLADATLDEVLALWAGLGYYTRARNLHRAAQIIMQQHDGCFPEDYEAVLALPGIGPSTAAAILAQALGQRQVILDGNVKRVLARYALVEGWPGTREVEKRLWQLAEQLTPAQRLADYTQAIMDLGATLCTRSAPDCKACPVRTGCQAHASGRQGELPTPRPRKSLPVKATRMLLLTRADGSILLEKRPPAGLWGGLWSLPEAAPEQCIETLCHSRWGLTATSISDGPGFRHSFSHYHLDITPCYVQLEREIPTIHDSDGYAWCNRQQLRQHALAAPVASLLDDALSAK